MLEWLATELVPDAAGLRLTIWAFHSAEYSATALSTTPRSALR